MNRIRSVGAGFLLLLAFDTVAQICLKLAGNHAGPFEPTLTWVYAIASGVFVYGAIAGYLGAFFTWITLLKNAPIGPAFAASHLDVISVLILSAVLFQEPIRPAHIVGCLAIVAGIVCLAMNSSGDDKR